MNPLTDLDRQISSMQLPQLLLLFVFLTAYVAAIGRMLESRGRWRAAGIAALAAIGLCVAIRPWTVGALVVVACIGSVGLFVLSTMLVCRAIGRADVVIREHMARSAMMTPGFIPGAVSDDHLSPAVAAVRRRDLRRRSLAAPF